MASLPQQNPASKTRLTVSLFRNAMKQKHGFIQFFAMTGILLLSCRSLGQKYRIHDLQQDAANLEDENISLQQRLANIKSNLRREAVADSSSVFANRLRVLFGDDDN